MNAAKRAKVIESFLETYSGPVMKDKGGAYSRGEENSNSNFYRVGEALGHTPMETAWVYALKHIDAISAYIKGDCQGDVVGGEPVEGRIGDAVNYLLILYSILVQEGLLENPVADGKENPHAKGTIENPWTPEDAPENTIKFDWLVANKPLPFYYQSKFHLFLYDKDGRYTIIDEVQEPPHSCLDCAYDNKGLVGDASDYVA